MIEGSMKRKTSSSRSASIAAICVAVSVAGCASTASQQPSAASGAARSELSEIARTSFDPSLGVHLDSMMRHPSGLYVQDLVTGKGAVAARGRSVVVRYTGWLPNGKKFDASEITVTLGSNKTIRGWEEGLLGMRVGGKRRLIIPPNLGYGAKAAGEIPPNSVLVFEMEAMSVF